MIIGKIKTNKNVLYNDSKPIRFLEKFFKKEFKIWFVKYAIIMRLMMY